MFSSADQTSDAEKASQREKYGKIIELLIGAGYYRAKIAALSEFDKVIGGLCWCMASSGEALDIDVLFQENLNIGKRIKLSEGIVSGLVRMGCPFSLQAHQIQGNDFAAILPVMVWMINKTLVYRELMQESLRKCSGYQFTKNFNLYGMTSYSPTKIAPAPSKKMPRKYRRKASSVKPNDEINQVHSCLVEYGERLTTSGFARWNIAGGMASALSVGADTALLDQVTAANESVRSSELTSFERELVTLAHQLVKEEEDEMQHIAAKENILLHEMQQADEHDTGLSGELVGELVDQQSAEISAAQSDYTAAVETCRKQLVALKGGKAASNTYGSAYEGNFSEEMEYRRKKASAEKKLNAQMDQITILLAEVAALVEEKAKISQDKLQINANITELERVGEAICNQEAGSEGPKFMRLLRLVTASQDLASQENDFRKGCKAQLAQLQGLLRQFQEQTSDEETERFKEIEDMHGKIMAKEAKMRSTLAEKNIQCASLSRSVDDVPTRPELIQYERRFTELYDQVNQKLKENRKYYAVYNTLDTTLKFLHK